LARPERFRRPTDGALSLRTIVSGAERGRADRIPVLEHAEAIGERRAWRSISLLVSGG
jgi:hypothetical protein